MAARSRPDRRGSPAHRLLARLGSRQYRALRLRRGLPSLISLYEGAAHIGEQAAKMSVKPRCCCAINDAMIPRQRQRLIKARHKLLAVPHRFLERTAGSHDGNLRGIDDRGEVGPSNAAETGDRKSPTLHLIR